jgi:hypothetical protein
MHARTILLLALATSCAFALAALLIRPIPPTLEVDSSREEFTSRAVIDSTGSSREGQSATSHRELLKTQGSQFPAGPFQANLGFRDAPVFASSLFGEGTADDSAFLEVESEMSEAAHSFSEAGLNRLAPLVSHDSARVRAAAVDAILQMGLPSATKLLRDAAAKATSPEEKQWLEEAAAFNELPSVSLERFKKRIGR